MVGTEAPLQIPTPTSEGWNRWHVGASRESGATSKLAFRLFCGEVIFVVHAPAKLEDFHLSPDAAPLKELSESTGVRFFELGGLSDLPGAISAAPSETQHTLVYYFWKGW